MSDPQTHPTPDELNAYSLGQLPSAQANAVESHVTVCTPCAETLMELSAEDTFLGLLREADRNPSNDTIDLDAIPARDSGYKSIEQPAALRNHPRFEVISLVGYGGMGEVYKARHRLMDRMVALKVIHRKFIRSTEAVERFRREVRAAAHLIHPNIVTAYDAEQADDTHVLAMEFVEGEELSEIVRQQGWLAVDLACDYAQQVARGLQHAFEMGMVHRDIKPQNLMVAEDGVVKILDFGLASFVHDALEQAESQFAETQSQQADAVSPLTTEGAVVGTPDYIAPEQAGDAHAADIRSDIYSLGCTLYYMLIGRAPFAGGSVTQKLHSHQRVEAAPLAEAMPNVPQELSEIVSRMMSKDPDDRFQTPQQVIEALAPFAEHETPIDSSAPPRRRPPLVAALVGFAGFAAIMVATVIWRVQTPLGTVEVRADEAIADDIQVVLSSRGEKVSVLHQGEFAIDLEEGVYQVSLESPNARAQLRQDRVSIKRGETTMVEVTLREELGPIKCTGEPLLATLEGHAAEISDLAYAKRHELLASSSFDGTIRLWSADTGREIAVLRGHVGKVWSVDFSTDGKTLASSGIDGKVIFWDITQREIATVFKEDAAPTNDDFHWLPAHGHLEFSPDGKSIAIDDGGNSISIWDAKTGDLVHRISEDNQHLGTFAFGPDGRMLVVANKGPNPGTLTLWNLESGKKMWSVVAGLRPVKSLAFSPDGKTVATGNANHSAYLFDVETGEKLNRLGQLPSGPMDTAFSPEGKLVASAFAGIWLFDTQTQRELAVLKGHFSDQVSLVFLDSRTLASAGYDRDIRIWDIEAALGKTLVQTFNPPDDIISHDNIEVTGGAWKVTADDPRTVRLFELHNPELSTGRILYRAKMKSENVTGRAYLEMWVRVPGKGEFFSKGFHHAISGDNGWAEYEVPFELAKGQQPDLIKLNVTVEGTGTVWIKDVRVRGTAPTEATTEIGTAERSVRSREPLLATLKGHEAEISDIAYARESKLLASSSFDGTIKLWDGETRSLVDTLRGHEGKVRSVSISPDESTLASSGEDGTIRLWHLAERGEGRVFQQGLPSWSDVRFSPDGHTLASDGKDNSSVAIWDIETGKKIHNLALGDREPETFAFSPDGSFLAVSSHRWVDEGNSSKTGEGYLSLWDTATGRRMWSFVADPRTVPSLGFSPDGRLLATGQANHRTYVRSVAMGQQLWEASGHPSWVWSTKFSPDGRFIASACQRIALWDVTMQKDVAKLPGHYSDEVSLVFLDSKTLASAGYDRDIKLWNLEAAIPDTDDAKKEEEGEKNSQAEANQLQGFWRFLYFQEPGRQPEPKVNFPRVEITSDSIIFRADDEDLELTTLAFSMDPSTDPGQIDIEGEFVRGRPVVRLGIYEVDKHKLRIALARPGKQRPDSFHDYDADVFTFVRRIERTDEYSDSAITFETILDKTIPVDGMEISAHFLATHGVRFYLEGGGFPRIAKVGPPATAFAGPPLDLGDDNPVDVDRVGDYFLTDDKSLGGGTSRAIVIGYDSPTSAASGDILDLDFDEKLVIQPLDAFGEVLDTLVIAAGAPETGDGMATPWSFERDATDVHSVRFQVTRREPGGLGFGLDNIVPYASRSPPQ